MAAENALYAKEDRRRERNPVRTSVDIPMLLLVLALLTLGLVMLYSASYAQSAYDTNYESSTRYLQKQALCAGIGLLCLWLFSHIPAAAWYRMAWVVYGVSILLLLLVLVVGESVNGAKRWINLAGIQFQPSELAKTTLVLILSLHFSKHGDRILDTRCTKNFGSI